MYVVILDGFYYEIKDKRDFCYYLKEDFDIDDSHMEVIEKHSNLYKTFLYLNDVLNIKTKVKVK